MKKRGKFIAVMMTMGAIACGSSTSTPTSEKISSPFQPAVKTSTSKSPVQTKPDVLIIGGHSEPLTSIVEKLSSVDSKNKNSKLAAFWEGLNEEFKNDFEKENFFTVVNTIDPDTRNMALGHFLGLETSVTSFSRKNSRIIDEPTENESAKYSLVLGNQMVAMNWDKKENRFIPASDFPGAIAKNPVAIQLQENGKRIVQTDLPLFTIQDTDLKKLSNLTFNLARDDYADTIHINPLSNQDQSDCFMISAWQNNGKEQVVVFTNFVDLQKKQLTFENFESENMEKLKGLTLNEKTGTKMICYNLQPKSDQNPYNTFTISAIPVTLKITDEVILPAKENIKDETANHLPETVNEKTTSEMANESALHLPPISPVNTVVAAPKKENAATVVKKNAPVIKKTVTKKIVVKNKTKAPAVIVKKPEENKEVAAPQNNDGQKTVDGKKLQINPLDTIKFVKPVTNKLFDTK